MWLLQTRLRLFSLRFLMLRRSSRFVGWGLENDSFRMYFSRQKREFLREHGIRDFLF